MKLWIGEYPRCVPRFAEMKRSLRETPQLNILGGLVEQPVERLGPVTVANDWAIVSTEDKLLLVGDTGLTTL